MGRAKWPQKSAWADLLNIIRGLLPVYQNSSRSCASKRSATAAPDCTSGASIFSAELFACNVWAGPSDLAEHKGAKITPSQRMDNTTSRRRGERMNLTPLSFASATPSKTSWQYIIIVRLNRHHQNYPVQTLQTLAPTTPPHESFSPQKTRREGTAIP